LTNRLYDAAMQRFNQRNDALTAAIGPRLGEIYEQLKESFTKNIIVPFTDGKRIYQIPCNLQEAAETNGRSVVKTFMKSIMLHIIDDSWKSNLRDLDDLKQSVQNAHYEQKDPLLIYKLESYKLFEQMVTRMNERAVGILMHSQLHMPERNEEVRQAAPEQRQDYSKMQATHNDASTAGTPAADKPKPQPVVAQPHVGRNDPCPCGSGKKYKNCHGRDL
jgi:preprotein translocase subunit SecA